MMPRRTRDSSRISFHVCQSMASPQAARNVKAGA